MLLCSTITEVVYDDLLSSHERRFDCMTTRNLKWGEKNTQPQEYLLIRKNFQLRTKIRLLKDYCTNQPFSQPANQKAQKRHPSTSNWLCNWLSYAINKYTSMRGLHGFAYYLTGCLCFVCLHLPDDPVWSTERASERSHAHRSPNVRVASVD